MKALFRSWIVRVLTLLMTAPVTFAQDRAPFRQAELDQMLAPVALYPDSLLSQILMASTYPLEVVQAARWSRANPGLKGQDAVRAVESMDWDPSVKSLTAFPQILTMMDERLEWTERLGEAFVVQEPRVMETIQGLRQRAAAAGNLGSSAEMRITRQGSDIVIEPPGPQVVYVPYYDPAIVYGTWWWPAYPPVYWGPPPGYYVSTVHAPGFIWGSGIVIGTGFFFGHFNWHHRHVVVIHKHVQVTHHTTFDRRHTNVTSNAKPVVWKHDPVHRRGVPFRHAGLRQEFGRFGSSGSDARRDHDRPAAAPIVQHRDAARPAGLREGRANERGDSVSVRERREAAPNRTVTQGNDKSTDGRERASFDPDARGSRPTRPAAQNNDRRLEPIRDTTRVQERGTPPHPAPMAPVVRLDARTVVANPNGNRRQAAIPDGARHPEARSIGDRGHFSRQVTTLRDNAPASRPSASGGSPAPRMGNVNHRSGGGAFRQQSRGTSAR